jgi:SAM-dependent methyltransferase
VTQATPDWGSGRYERTAEALMPAARALVDAAEVRSGERVLDLGCGTGNAALLAAERGAIATGVDPAQRLLQVAREQADALGLRASFTAGDAASIPAADGSFDAVLSAFGVIFAPDAAAATREMVRVTAPGGRILVTAWIPGGAISDSLRVVREAVTRALGGDHLPTPFAWHDPSALAALFAPHGFSVATTEHEISFSAPSAREHVDADLRDHPLAAASRAVLEPRGELDSVRDRMVEVLDAGNEDDGGGLRVTSRYVIAEARPSG